MSRRVAAITPSATLAVDAQAKALKAAGEPVIGFGAGEPDFPTPDHIVEAAVEAARNPLNHRYTPAVGLPELREAVAAAAAQSSGLQVTPEQVLITNGGKHALYNTFLTLIDEGDEVLLPAPYWTTYPEPIRLAGGVPVVLGCDESTGFRVTVDQLEAARTERTKILVFVSPSNPTGIVYPEAEVAAIGSWAAEHGIWVVTDEIYQHLTYGEHRFSSMPVVVPEVAERCVVLDGVAKTYAMTGWRVGWMIAPPAVAKAAASLQSHQTSNVCNVAQRAAIAALTGGLDDLARMREAYLRRGALMCRLLNEIDGVSCIEPQGAFYCFPNLSEHLGRPIAGRTAETTVELAATILEEAKVAIVPGEAFAGPGYARLSFATGDDEITEGIGRIAELLGRS